MAHASSRSGARPWAGWAGVTGLAFALAPLAAFADDDRVTDRSVWTSWDLSPGIVIPTCLVLGIYFWGLAKRPGAVDAHPWRFLSFVWGVLLIFLSLASPADALSDHLFFMHQAQHMLLRMIGPMLIMLGQPQALFIAGTPGWLKRGLMGPAAGARPVRALFSGLAHPAVVTFLFVASLYAWQWPPFQDAAILNEDIHYGMHATMLAAGLLFFWRVFDPRPSPKGARFGVRLMMLWVAVLADIPIGAYTTFKTRELYPAYDVAGRLFHIAPLTDEGLGGFIMWAPASMMLLIAVLIVIHGWAREEERQDARRRTAAAAGREMIPPPRTGNRVTAWGLAGFAVCVLAATVTLGLLSLRMTPSRQAERILAEARAEDGAARLHVHAADRPPSARPAEVRPNLDRADLD